MSTWPAHLVVIFALVSRKWSKPSLKSMRALIFSEVGLPISNGACPEMTAASMIPSCCATPTGTRTATWDRSTDPFPNLNTFSTWYSLMGPNPRCWINSSKAVNVVSSRSQSPLLHSQVMVRDPTAKLREPQWLPQMQELHPRPDHHPVQLRHSWQPFALKAGTLFSSWALRPRCESFA